ncbi:hypothetical protein [Wolbachia endosymbiont (group B) of Villa cingulata]|uniref:hypothetical protein n=1 Tax=Wolbachia endosymbiont (group B) of Villa cingulata TaxID=3066157 RepID=UPI003341E203
MKFEQCVKDDEIDLSHLHDKKIGDFLTFMDKNPNINYFNWADKDTSNSIKFERSRNISNNMKLRCIGAGVGLVAGLVAGCCLGQETLTLIGVSGVVLIAFAIVGALLGAGAGYVVGKCLDKIKVTNMQGERSC